MRWKHEAVEREKAGIPIILPKEEARIQLLELIRIYFESSSDGKELQRTIQKIERILSLFDNETERTNIYNKLLKIPVPVIIEQLKIMDALDNGSIINFVRNFL